MLLARILLFLLMAVGVVPEAVAQSVQGEPRIALIITNQGYGPDPGALTRAHRDGDVIGEGLQAVGFRVTRAGHGAADAPDGANYLIPVGVSIASASDLLEKGVKLSDLIDRAAKSGAKTNFIVFDACRDVPRRSISPLRGFRSEADRPGLLIAFATDPGKTALDNGAYADALSAALQRPGIEAVEVFREVRRHVWKMHQQFPWVSEGLVESFYFTPPTSPTNQSASPRTPHGVWAGGYECRDGQKSNVEIALRFLEDGSIRALFAFETLQGRPELLGKGASEKRGKWDQATSGFRLSPERWVRQPSRDYRMLPVQAQYSPEADVLLLKFSSGNCHSPRVKRIPAPVLWPQAWDELGVGQADPDVGRRGRRVR